ncbi:MAG: acetyl-CoA decarbonylase/synthase complex subunit beta, partial [Thermoproteota archaeon]
VLERVKDFVPPHLIGKIATEKDAMSIEELKEFLKEKNHPIVARWKELEEVAVEAVEGAPEVGELMELPAGVGGFRIRLENVRIVAKKAVIRKVSKHEKRETS